MKMLAFALSFCLFALPSKGAQSIIDLIPVFAKNPAIKVTGWDQVAGINDKLSNSSDTVNIPKGMTLADAVHAIASSTDYSSISTQDCVIIAPKENDSRYNTPLSRRLIVVPQISNLSVDEALRKISAANGPDFLLQSNHSLVRKVTGTLSLSAGNYPCYEVLNRMAVQLNAKTWIINNGMDVDLQGKTIYPIRLGVAQVSFFFFK